MSFLSKQSNSFLRSFALGRKYLAWKEASEMRALQARYAQLTWEIAELGNEMSRRKGLMKDARRS